MRPEGSCGAGAPARESGEQHGRCDYEREFALRSKAALQRCKKCRCLKTRFFHICDLHFVSVACFVNEYRWSIVIFVFVTIFCLLPNLPVCKLKNCLSWQEFDSLFSADDVHRGEFGAVGGAVFPSPVFGDKFLSGQTISVKRIK
jgi:hypothetical protein